MISTSEQIVHLSPGANCLYLRFSWQCENVGLLEGWGESVP